MNLSPRAQNYIKSLTRDPAWTTKPQETETYFSKLHNEYSKNLLDTQLSYGGLNLEIKSSKSFSAKIRFISQRHIDKQVRLHTEKINEDKFYQFDNGEGPQLFFINQNGLLSTKDEEHTNKFHLAYQRLETKLEQYALLNEYKHLTNFSSGNHNVIDQEALKTNLHDFNRVEECCDTYNLCCLGEQILIINSPWLEGEGCYVEVFGINEKYWKRVIRELQEKYIIE